MTVALIIAYGLVNWWVTVLVVDSEFFRPLREVFFNAYTNAERKWSIAFWDKLCYLVKCHMCTGTWVGFLLAAFAPAVFGPGWIGFILVALLIKAIGHLVLTAWHLLEAVTKEREAAANARDAETRRLVRS